MTQAYAANALSPVMRGMSGPEGAACTASPNGGPDAEASDPRALGWMQGRYRYGRDGSLLLPARAEGRGPCA